MTTSHEQHLRNLYAAISGGATGDDLAAFWHRDAEQVEYPSIMRPSGHRRALAQILDQPDRVDHGRMVTPAELAPDFGVAARRHHFGEIHGDLTRAHDGAAGRPAGGA